MNRIEVSGEMIRWARERSKLSFETLAGRFPRLPQWESGDKKPTMKQLEDYASATMAPLGYFFLPEPPVEALPIPDFRTVRDAAVARPGPNLLDTVYSMQRRQAWLRDERIEHGAEALNFIGSLTPQTDAAVIAGSIRERLGFSAAWAQAYATWGGALDALADRMEDVGAVVVSNGVVGNNTHRKLDPEEFRGFVLVDDYAPLIFVNGADAKAAQMFTLAHEIAHLWIGQDALIDLREMMPADSDVERLCNRVAAEFLVPAALLQPFWPEIQANPNRFHLIARRFKVSEIVAARRALDLGLVAIAQFFEFYNEYIAQDRQRPKATGGNFYANQNNRIGKTFGRAVVQAVREGRLLYRDAYALTSLQGATFDNFAARVAA